ncbi:ATP-binding protein [Paraglaciecola sp. 2405UD69-4]|uniref:ATP-binding protein n=1 Tax=Paraglaciecola sp. 2405UD69-4 TaxID=3391836 RepID=UPI0039C90F17
MKPKAQPSNHAGTSRRIYTKLVANEMIEDFALRYTSRRARKWSYSKLAITALGIVSFMVLEAIGGAITLNYGFTNAAWAILALVVVVFISGLPISYYAARYGVDADLLTRGAGFGYLGSTITSLIYASFTFIFFALEAAIMAMALFLWLDIPLSLGYAISALVVIPLASHGITNISRFQIWTQTIWIVLQLIPLLYVFNHPESSFKEWITFEGDAGAPGSEFNILLFGAASAVLLSLVAQIGEQVDFLRFLPSRADGAKPVKWWAAVVLAGPGWVIFGAAKLFLGSFLAYFALQQGVARDLANDPAHMYQIAFGYIFNDQSLSIAVAAIFVILSQLKINVANAYAGSLAWSNFFSRLTHHHPGRVVWMVFNILIALLLMELGVYQTIESMLQIYSVLVLAWLSSVAADLIINKPLGLSPKHIEFRRSKLYDINPVGIVSMVIASAAGFCAHSGMFGELTQALGSYVAFVIPFITVPVIGYITGGKYYLVSEENEPNIEIVSQDTPAQKTCFSCENEFDLEDMAFCPAYGKSICSLCCSLDVRCGDKCRETATFTAQVRAVCRNFFSEKTTQILSNSVAQWAFLTVLLGSIIAAVLLLIYKQMPDADPELDAVFTSLLMKTFFFILIIVGVISWLFTLARTSTRAALKELREQTSALAAEVSAHEKTTKAYQLAMTTAESSSQAKSRYLAGLSHELRTPLNVLLGYAQLLTKDASLADDTAMAIKTIRRNGEHLADLIEGVLEVSKIEAGRLYVHRDEIQLRPLLEQLVNMFKLQAVSKGLDFQYDFPSYLPDYATGDKQRLRQVLINIISNAIKFTTKGYVRFTVEYKNEVAHFSVTDTGCGISEQNLEQIFRPFERVSETESSTTGTGLGLTISRGLAEVMGGDISVKSTLNEGSEFKLSLYLPKLVVFKKEVIAQKTIKQYTGAPKTILIVDDEAGQRDLVNDILQPIGFTVIKADSAFSAMSALNTHTIDLILLDLKMPGVNGWQAAKQFREAGFTQPIVIISANVRDLEVSNTVLGQHNDYLVKPFAINALLEKVGYWLKLTWEYEEDPTSEQNQTSSAKENGKLAGLNQYKALKVLAEIGYLSGFTSKLNTIHQEFDFPDGVYQELKEFAQQCQFKKINEKLETLIESL